MVEIGFGNGGFLTEQAARRPEANFVGIERAWGSVQRLLKRLDRDRLDNVRVVQSDAAFVFERLFAPGSMEEIFINRRAGDLVV